MDRKTYLANCIGRILASDRNLLKTRELEMDLAEAVVIAGRDGEERAHKYLQELCDAAEAGKYSS